MTKLTSPEKLTRAKIRVKLKSLGEEVRIIRTEERKLAKKVPPEHRWVVGSLMSHRRDDLGPEIRATHWAYAILKGIPYSKIEASTKSVPSTIKWLESRTATLLYAFAKQDSRAGMDVRGWRLAGLSKEVKTKSA